MKPRLNIVTLGVADLPRSRQFYQDAFGWKPAKGSDENIVFYSHAGIILGLYPMHLLAEDAEVPADRKGFSGVTLAINTRTREELEETHRKAIAAGAKSLVEPRDTFWEDTIRILPIRMDTRGKLPGRHSGNSTNREV